MKKILTIFALLPATVCTAQEQWNHHYIIHVINAANFKEPAVNLQNTDNEATYKADLSRHKDGEVNVYRTSGPMGLGYTVNYYKDEQGTIQHHGFSWSSTEVFDQADYTWSKDTLCVQLFNKDKKDKIYKGFGRGGSNSMVIPD